MKTYTLRILENNANAKALLEYIKTLDFVILSPKQDWYDEFTTEQKESIKKGLADVENGNIHSSESVQKHIANTIAKARKKQR